jgi:hypothetical protein
MTEGLLLGRAMVVLGAVFFTARRMKDEERNLGRGNLEEGRKR